MKKILMCPPEFYNIEYVINPWMDLNNKVNKEKAFRAYNSLKKIYLDLGAEVVELMPIKGLPDQVYAANLGYAENNIFIKSNYKAPQRKDEARAAKDFFEKAGYKVYSLPEEIIFEGEGDIIRSEHKYFFGWGKRSMKEAVPYLEKILNKIFTDLELIDPYYYHLDTCFAPLNDNVVIINSNSFTHAGLDKIKKNFGKIIYTNDQDNKVLACNLVVVDNTVVINSGISDELAASISEEGYKIIKIDMSEFMLGGGSVKCLTQEIF